MNTILISAIWGVIMMFAGAFIQNRSIAKYLAIAGVAILFIANGHELWTGHSLIQINTNDMLRMSSYNLTFLAVILGCTGMYFMLSGRDIEKAGAHVAEYFALIFFILCGVGLSATFNSLLMLFLGIEIITIPLYILTGSAKGNLKSIEAALKYFLMGAFSTGLMLMGIAFIYGGNPNASFYINQIAIGTGPMTPMIAIGLVFLFVSMSFKVSAAPFHFWTPDVYDGAPTVFTSFMSTIVKAAGFFAFIRLFENAFGQIHDQWQNLVIFVTLATLFIGNITAVFQQSVKRMLAYSSIAQAGFMIFVLFSMNDRAREGLIVYAAAYSLATIGLFAILTRMKDYTIEGFNGLSKTQPVLAFTATIFLLSLTGIPLTAGFQGKFFMLLSAIENGKQIWLVIAAVIFAAISAYYYFRLIQAMYFKDAISETDNAEDITGSFKFLLILTGVLLLIIGVYPELIVGWIYH